MADILITGVSGLEARLRSISANLRRSIESAIQEEAGNIVKRAKDEFVPVDSGELRDSIRVEKSGISQGRDEGGRFTSEANMSISVVAGGPGIEYAVAVHETPSDYDPPTWEGKKVNFTKGGAKYLEKPLFEAENGMIERIAGKVKF